MEQIVSRENMMTAYRRVVANKGAPGIDKMPVEQLKPYLKDHWPRIKEELLAGRYRPAPVRGVEIPKPGGKGMRLLGIPTVVWEGEHRKVPLYPIWRGERTCGSGWSGGRKPLFPLHRGP